MSENTKRPANIGTTIKRAIRQLHEGKGSSFADIKKYMTSMNKSNGDTPDLMCIKQYLKNAVDKGDILKLDDGKYKIKEAARRRRSRSKSRSRGKSRRRSRSRKRSRSGGRKRRRSKSGGKRKRSSSGKRRRRRRSKKAAEDE